MAGLRDEEIEAAFPGAMSRRAVGQVPVALPRRRELRRRGRPGRLPRCDVIAASGAVRPLLVSHEMIGRMLLRNLLDLTPEEALAYGHPHGVIYRVDVAAKTLEEIRA